MSFVVDRRSGDPIASIPVRVWIDQKEVASKTNRPARLGGHADQQPLSRRTLPCWRRAQTSSPSTRPARWNLGDDPNRNLKGYTYTDRPVYRPGDTVHFKTIVRSQTASGYTIPQGQELRLELRDPQTYDVIWTQTVTLSRHGHGELELSHSRRRTPRLVLPLDADGRALCRRHELLGRGVQEAGVRGEGDGADAARAARPADQGDHRRALLLRRAGGQCQGQVGGAHLDVLADGTHGR